MFPSSAKHLSVAPSSPPPAMMAFVTATAAVTSSSVAIRSFRAHEPSFAPDLDEVEQPRPWLLDLVVVPPPPSPHAPPSPQIWTRSSGPAHGCSTSPSSLLLLRHTPVPRPQALPRPRSRRGRATPPRSGQRRGRVAAMGEAGIRCFVAEGRRRGLIDCVVVGGENSGLCIAQALTTKHHDKAPDVVVTEAKDRVGDDHVVKFLSLHRVIFH